MRVLRCKQATGRGGGDSLPQGKRFCQRAHFGRGRIPRGSATGADGGCEAVAGARAASRGPFIRREPAAREISLRERTRKTGGSPTCMSKAEREGFAPPTEAKAFSFARMPECDPDVLLAMGGAGALP